MEIIPSAFSPLSLAGVGSITLILCVHSIRPFIMGFWSILAFTDALYLTLDSFVAMQSVFDTCATFSYLGRKEGERGGV